MKSNTRRRRFLFIALIFLLAQQAVVSQPAKFTEKNDRQRAVILVKEFANRAFSFDDASTRVLSIARFADLLWKDDEAHARQLFARALEACTPKTDATPSEISRLTRLRREVIALISSRDVNLARQLTKDGDDSGSAVDAGATNLRVANKLLKTQPEQAVGFAERSLESGVSLDLVFFLLRLRTQNEAMADRLFVDVLNRLSTMPCTDPEALILLGTYVFTFSNSNAEPNVTATTIKYIGIGPVMLPDISVERQGVPRYLMAAYVEAGANALNGVLCPSQDRATLYAASYLLLKKSGRLAPDLSPRIASSMQSLRQSVPAELTEDETYKKIDASAATRLEDTLAEIESKGGTEHRDMQYFALVFDLWRRSDFEKARMVSAKISDANLRERLARLILFGEAARSIEKGDKAETAERMSAKLPPGVERALLRLGLASLYAKKKDTVRAEESINASLRDARQLDDDRVPFIILAAASELARIHSPDAMTVLGESVRKLNARKADSVVDVDWEEKVTCGVLWRNWPLEIKGIDNSFSRALPYLMKVDADVTVETILKIAPELYLSEALLETASIVLQGRS